MGTWWWFSNRIAIVNMENTNKPLKFHIKPDLNDSQKSQLLAILTEYSDGSAKNPKPQP